MLACQEVEL
jgi:hypothetical protein